MPDYLGADQRKTKEDEKDDKPIRVYQALEFWIQCGLAELQKVASLVGFDFYLPALSPPSQL